MYMGKFPLKIYHLLSLGKKVNLNNINLEINKGSFVGIVGKSGSGKAPYETIGKTLRAFFWKI